MNEVKLLAVREVAGILNVNPKTVRQWSNQGLIKSYRIGPRRDRRFSKKDINSFLNRSEEKYE